MNRPGMHMVAILWIKVAKDIMFVSNDLNPLTFKSIIAIGKSKLYKERRKYKEKSIGKIYDSTVQNIKDIVKGYSNRRIPSFLDSYNNLIQWYRDTTDE